MLPILVAELLSASDNAHWYIVWMMAWVIYQVPNSVGIALFAEAAAEPSQVAVVARRALRVTLLLGGAGAALLAVLATPVLRILGPDFAAEGTTPFASCSWESYPWPFSKSATPLHAPTQDFARPWSWACPPPPSD